jgi:PAS domain S-box-containing protein
VILSDNSLPQLNAMEALRITRQRFLHIPFILVTGTVSEEYAATIIKLGADDYILKDRMARLPSAIDAALKQRQALKELTDYKYALDHSAIVAITDQKGTIIYANENFCRISRYSVEELIGQDHRIINSAYHPPEFIRNLWVTIANGNIWRGEFRNKAKDGSFYWVDTTIIPFLNEKGKPYQYLSIRIDISERKKMEAALETSNERLQYVTRSTSDVIWELNFESKQYFVHEGKEKIFGINKKINWQLGTDGKYIIEEDRERIRKSFNEARKDPKREFWDEEYRIFAQGNTILYVANHAIFIRNAQGRAVRAIGAISDISERKSLELQLLEQQRKEQQKVTATALEAQEKERNYIGQELHDNVNQILVGTKLLLAMVKNNPIQYQHLCATALENLQKAIDENRRLAHELVTPDLETENLADQIERLSRNMLKAAGISTNVNIEHLADALLDKAQKLAVYRIAQEQCTNIVKYAQASIVDIKVAVVPGFFRMSIADNGRGARRVQKDQGTGLKNINARLSVLSGSVIIDTAPGRGFRLQIEIPLENKNGA